MFQPRAADYCQTPARPWWVIDLESGSQVFVATPMTQRKSTRRTAHLNPAWIAEPQNCKSRIIIVDNYIQGRGSYYAAIDRNRTQSWRFGWHKHHYHYHLFATDHTQDRTWRTLITTALPDTLSKRTTFLFIYIYMASCYSFFISLLHELSEQLNRSHILAPPETKSLRNLVVITVIEGNECLDPGDLTSVLKDTRRKRSWTWKFRKSPICLVISCVNWTLNMIRWEKVNFRIL